MTDTTTTTTTTPATATTAATPTPSAPPERRVLNTATLIVGPTRTGKSSLLATAAEYIWEEHKKVSHYCLTDGGGFPAQMQALISHGIVRLWRLRTRSGRGLAFETCQRAAQGWWPTTINPHTGEVHPNAKLVAPVTTLYRMICPNGHVMKSGPAVGALTPGPCPTCQVMVTAQTMRIETETSQTPGFEKVGGLLIDGLSSMCAWMMDDLSERSGRSELGGEKSALGTIVSGDLHIGGSNRAMYGTVQARAEAVVLASSGVPNLVIPPVWTALTHETSDEGGLSIRGPLLAGNAKTGVAPQWFGDVMESAIEEDAGKRYRVLHLQGYVDDKGIRHLCGVRTFPGMIDESLREEEGSGEPFAVFSLGHFYRLRDAALAATQARYSAKYADAPGVEQVSYGEGTAQTPATPTSPRPSGPSAASKAAAPAGRPAAKPTPAAAAAARARQASQAKAPATTPAAAPPPPAATAAPTAAPAPAPAPKPAAAPAPRALSPAERARMRTAPAATRAPGPQAAQPAQPTQAAPAPPAAPTEPSGPSPAATGPHTPPLPPPMAPAAGPLATPPGRRPPTKTPESSESPE